MRVEVINTGTELLLGSVVNTHLGTLAQALFSLGLRIERQVTVPDGESIREALIESLGRSEVVFVTGGLGPTTDDLTRDIAAELLGRSLHFHPEVMAGIEALFAARGLPMTDRVSRQAQVPEGARILPNHHGTAPGLYLECPPSPLTGGRVAHLFLLPGPPRELKPMLADAVMPILRELVPVGPRNECRLYHVLGVGESNVEALVGEALCAIPELELGYCARPGEVDIRCIGPKAALETAEAIILKALGDRIAARDGRPLPAVVVETLTQRGETLAIAESCTGGSLAGEVTNVPGASAVLRAGYVTYANEAKMRDLGVDAALIETHGAVSEPVAAAMALGALRRAGTDWALATTGIAGPGGGSEAKPVGTVFIALARKQKDSPELSVCVERHLFRRDRISFKRLVIQTALDRLRRSLES